MNPFVNFAKRDVALPGGCSDLIEVQQLQRKSSQASRKANLPIRLTDLDRTISDWLKLPSKFTSLWIDAGAGLAVVALFRGEEGLGLRILITFQAACEPNVRNYLNESISPPVREKSFTFGNESYLSIAGSLGSAENLAEFVRELFMTAIALPEDVSLQVQCNELVEGI
jgi:hypothetical protein